MPPPPRDMYSINVFTCLIPENEQKVAPVKDQAQQVQRVRTAGSVLPVLLHLGLQHPDGGTRAKGRHTDAESQCLSLR